MEAAPDTRGGVRFGPFELDVRARELRTDSRVVRLQDQPFEILRTMLERPGDVVTREELRRRLWPDGTFVDFEHSLNAAVKRLRAALGDDADNPRFVETLPRRGYRFIARLNRAEPSVRAPVPPPHGRTRIAVLPFRDLGTDHESFADGLTEELISKLGGLCRTQVEVVARWSSMVMKGTTLRARDVGEALNAAYLLEGSVRRDGDRVRVVAHLVEAAGETQLWSETYERSLRDVFSVQADVAARIARSLAAELAPGGDTPARCDPVAYQIFLKGRYYWNKKGEEGLDQAIDFYGEALAAAPSYAEAHAAMARARLAQATSYRDVPRRALAEARRLAEHALDLDPRLYEAHIARAEVSRMLDGDWRAAAEGYDLALALNPSFELAYRARAQMLSALGHHAEAIRESERACVLDPLCLTVGASAAWVAYAAREAEASIQFARNTLDMDPGFLPARRVLGAAYLLAGDSDAACRELETSLSAGGRPDMVTCAWLAHARATRGETAAARALVAHAADQREGYVSRYHLAIAHAGLGDVDAAFDALDAAWLDRDPSLATLAVEPRLTALRDDARFDDLLVRLNLPRPGR